MALVVDVMHGHDPNNEILPSYRLRNSWVESSGLSGLFGSLLSGSKRVSPRQVKMADLDQNNEHPKLQ